VVFADAQDIAGFQFVRIVAAEGTLVVVDVGAVAARVLQHVAALVIHDACVASRYVTHIIGQHPVVLGGASNASTRNSEDKRTLVAHSMAMITDDAQPERHVSVPSGP
jgi:hypothetical protein